MSRSSRLWLYTAVPIKMSDVAIADQAATPAPVQLSDMLCAADPNQKVAMTIDQVRIEERSFLSRTFR